MIEEEGDRVALTGQEIDEVKVSYLGASEYNLATYRFYYGVRCDVEGVEKQVKARMKIQTKGLIKRKVVDFKWVGGELADELNRDDELKKQLLQQLKERKRRRLSGHVESPPEVFLDKKAGIVWIKTDKYMPPFPTSVKPFQLPKDLMPPETRFKIYNAIAKHIRNRVSPQSG